MDHYYIPTFNGTDITLWVVAYLTWRSLTGLKGKAQQPAPQPAAPFAANPRTRLWKGFLTKGGGAL